MIKNFTIFGERNSGTNYLKSVLEDNLKIPFTQKYGYKHWFIKNLNPRGEYNYTTDNECRTDILSKESDETLFIYIIRNPFDWAGSMYKKPHHIKNSNMSSLNNFLKSPYLAFENKRYNKLWNYNKFDFYFIEKSENIITLRNEKNNHFQELGKTVKHFYVIRQEFLQDEIIKMIKKFKLELKYDKIKFNNYRKPYTYVMNMYDRSFILNNLKNDIDNKYYFINKLKR